MSETDARLDGINGDETFRAWQEQGGVPDTDAAKHLLALVYDTGPFRNAPMYRPAFERALIAVERQAVRKAVTVERVALAFGRADEIDEFDEWWTTARSLAEQVVKELTGPPKPPKLPDAITAA